jgi:hypothetical protein
MEKKPDLIVRLFAGDTLVDESADAALWQRVLAEIRGLAPAPVARQTAGELPQIGESEDTPIAKLARRVGLATEQVMGSLDPTGESPFIHLNSHDWEALKKNTPLKGPGSVAPSVLAATALVLWQKDCGIGDVTLATVRAVMGTIDLDDPNAARSVGNCDWLQNRAGRITLNPSRSSAATRLIAAYCRREPIVEAK